MKRIIAFFALCVVLSWGLHGSVQAQEALIPSDVTGVRLDWNPNGANIAISDGGSVVTILDAQTRAVLNTLPVMPFPVRALRWSDDGSRLAVGGEYTIQIWDRAWDASQATLSLTLQVPPHRFGLGMLHALDWNDAAQQILADLLGRIYIWDSRTGEFVETIEPFTTPMVSAAWSPDGTRLAHADVTGFVSIVVFTTDEASGAEAYNRDAPWAMAWEPSGSNLVVGTSGGTLQAFDFSPRRLGSDVVSLREEYVAIFSVDWHPTQPLVAVAYADGMVEIWNPHTYDLVQRVQAQTGQPVMSVVWSPNGTQLAYAHGTNLVIVPAPTLELPTATPTRIPRMVETQAQSFHDSAAQFGIPAPFNLWPVVEPDLYQNGYGPNGFAYESNCATPPPPSPTPTPTEMAGPTPMQTLDRCPYRGVNSIHPGVDYYNGTNRQDPIGSVVIALCDGIVVPGTSESGGSARPNTGAGLSLRCFADDPRDADNDGFQNVSNIVVVYNHLTLDQGISTATPGGPYRIVQAGDSLATTTGYTFAGVFVQEHLDLQIYIAYGYQTGTGSIQLNPRLMFAYPSARTEAVELFAPSYDAWSLQGRRESNGVGSIHFWTNSTSEIFIEDMAQYLESSLLPSGTQYIGPNCTNVQTNTAYPLTCNLDRNDINITPTPSVP